MDKLMQENDICNKFTQNRLKNIIEKTMLHRNYYLVFPISLAYNLLEKNKTEENIFLANVLDWITELFVTSYFLLDDIMDNSETRWQQTCSYADAPKTILYDSKIMQWSGYNLLKEHFFYKPYYKSLNDIWDLYGNEKVYGKRGNDISQGKFTWLFAKAQEVSNATQLKIIANNYGKEDLDCCKTVESIYDELNLIVEYFKYKHEHTEDINSKTTEINDESVAKVFYHCLHFFEIADLMVLQDSIKGY
ncbi:hypothetical protein FQR65_LT19030 [Abscondita terminalis]|nr:hypothetical protein FQR65_LT19030 [Abscondita terminalis]